MTEYSWYLSRILYDVVPRSPETVLGCRVAIVGAGKGSARRQQSRFLHVHRSGSGPANPDGFRGLGLRVREAISSRC